uniref:NHL repeat containing protein n=1 Tax=Salvator merianae TaxID=96440 RepID=A0A8D0B7Y5_SALMN
MTLLIAAAEAPGRVPSGPTDHPLPGFHKPYLVASNARGEVAVSERGLDGGCCVKVLGAGWQVLRVLGTPGGSPPRLTNPWGVALDEAGQVLVADWGRQIHSVVCYPPRGAGWPVATEGLNSPRGVALLGERHLVVADSMHHCLKSFRY